MIRYFVFIAALLVSFAATALVEGDGAFSDEEPLPPDQAFKLSAYMLNDNTLRAEWDITDGYYMYRNKFKFSSENGSVSLDPKKASYPQGEIKEDEFFGKVESYRNKVAIDIPLLRLDNQLQSFQLKTVSQGCADLGVCYPPQTKVVSVNFPSVGIGPATDAVAPKSSGAFTKLKSLGQSLGLNTDDEEFLQVDEAFAYSNEVLDGNTLHVSWTIAEGYYLYRDKFKFSLKNASGISIGNYELPRGKMKTDQAFGDMEVFLKKVEFDLPLQRTKLDETEIILVANYQGCADKGFCYPPQTQEHPLLLPAGTSGPAIAPAATTPTATEDMVPLSEQDEFAATLATGSILWNMIVFFGAGLLLAFTPCVFPMIPILSSIIVGQGDKITTRKAFTMSLVYVLAMALTYTMAGVVAGVFGENLQAAFQNPWILGSFAGVFALLSLSMFGFYELQMPSSIQSKLTEFSNRQEGGTMIGVAIMGFLSALIVGPCVAAPLAGALIYIGQTGDPILGGAALFALSMGMGAPLLAIGTSAGKLLPRAGGWMEVIKAVFGVMLLAVAIWMLERILPGQITMLLWAALLIISAIFMGALEPIGAGVSGWRKFWKGIGLFMLVYGILLIIGAASGGNDPLAPLHRPAAMMTSATGTATFTAAPDHVPFKRIKGSEDLDRELAAAAQQGKTVLLDFYADWCISCKEMEKFTFSDAQVKAEMEKMVLLQADVTDNDEIDKALLKRFKLVGPPAILFFDKNSQEQRRLRVVGFLKAEKFIKRLELSNKS